MKKRQAKPIATIIGFFAISLLLNKVALNKGFASPQEANTAQVSGEKRLPTSESDNITKTLIVAVTTGISSSLAYIPIDKDANGEGLYAQVLSIVPQYQPGQETLDDLLDNGTPNQKKYLIFNIYAAHSVSGFGQFFSRKYYKSDIENGEEFEWGESTKIVKRE